MKCKIYFSPLVYILTDKNSKGYIDSRIYMFLPT